MGAAVVSGLGLGRLGPRRCPDCGQRWAFRVRSEAQDVTIVFKYRRGPDRALPGKLTASLKLECPDGHRYTCTLRPKPGGGVSVGIPVRS